MSKILILSNGHGEDLSGSLIAKEFVKSGYSVNALPIVGKGVDYEKEKIKIIGKTKEFRTGGIGYNSFKGRFTEICLLYTSPSPRDPNRSRMPSSA